MQLEGDKSLYSQRLVLPMNTLMTINIMASSLTHNASTYLWVYWTQTTHITAACIIYDTLNKAQTPFPALNYMLGSTRKHHSSSIF